MANNINELMNQLNPQISDSFSKDVVPKVKKELHEEILYTYEEYEPLNPQDRRYMDEGYGDEDLIVEDINITNRGISARIENLAEPRGEHKYGELELSYYIENGVYSKGVEVPARPAFQRTIDLIEDEDIIYKELKKSLAKKGIKLER